MVKLIQDLVRIPSRGGIDPYDPVLDCMAPWLAGHGLPCRRLAGTGGMTVALASEVTGNGPGPRYVLDACLDTAPFGDENAWTYPPASGQITSGWLHGRGSADSKAGAAIFAHVAALPGLAPSRLTWRSRPAGPRSRSGSTNRCAPRCLPAPARPECW